VGIGGGAGGLSISGSASAGVSASEGAFAGLRTSVGAPSRPTRLDPGRLVRASASAGLATDSGARFSVGGQATIEGSTSLSADVGASASLQSRMQFEED
jgi:hypothetical protein